ncbi:hypothetical protein AAIB78_001982 [Morganella morganii]
MKITGQAVSVTELIKGTSERFGNGGLSHFISGIKNSPEKLFGDKPERADIFRITDFAALGSLFREDIVAMDMTPFKKISDEINAFRKSQSSFSRFCKGRILDKIQKNCTNIIVMAEYFSRLPELHRDTTLPDSVRYSAGDVPKAYSDIPQEYKNIGKQPSEDGGNTKKMTQSGNRAPEINPDDMDKLPKAEMLDGKINVTELELLYKQAEAEAEAEADHPASS